MAKWRVRVMDPPKDSQKEPILKAAVYGRPIPLRVQCESGSRPDWFPAESSFERVTFTPEAEAYDATPGNLMIWGILTRENDTDEHPVCAEFDFKNVRATLRQS